MKIIDALALAGPTAVGKSHLALTLAQKINGEIVSVDAGAVYRDMNIGSAKPSPAAQRMTRIICWMCVIPMNLSMSEIFAVWRLPPPMIFGSAPKRLYLSAAR